MTKVVMLFLMITVNGGRIVGKQALIFDSMDQCAGAASYSLNKNKVNKLNGLTVQFLCIGPDNTIVEITGED